MLDEGWIESDKMEEMTGLTFDELLHNPNYEFARIVVGKRSARKTQEGQKSNCYFKVKGGIKKC